MAYVVRHSLSLRIQAERQTVGAGIAEGRTICGGDSGAGDGSSAADQILRLQATGYGRGCLRITIRRRRSERQDRLRVRKLLRLRILALLVVHRRLLPT